MSPAYGWVMKANYLFAWLLLKVNFTGKYIRPLKIKTVVHNTLNWYRFSLMGRRECKKNTTARSTGTSLNKRLKSSGPMAAHFTFYVLVNFFASSAKHQPEMTKLCVVWWTWTTTADILNFCIYIDVVYHNQFRDSFYSEKQTKYPESIARFLGKI